MAIGLWIIISVVLIKENIEKAEFEATENRAKKINEKIEASFEEHKSVENSLRDMQTRNDVLLSIKKELYEVYGEKWLSVFDEYDDEFVDVKGHDPFTLGFPYGNALYIILSKRAKIPWLSAYSKWTFGGLRNEKYAIKTYEIVERNIQNTYPELRLVFVPRRKLSYDGKDAGWYDELHMGRLSWEHNLPRRDRNWNPPIKRLW